MDDNPLYPQTVTVTYDQYLMFRRAHAQLSAIRAGLSRKTVFLSDAGPHAEIDIPEEIVVGLQRTIDNAKVWSA